MANKRKAASAGELAPAQLAEGNMLFASDLPPYVSDDWRETANALLYEAVEVGNGKRWCAELKRILSDSRMKNFWSAFDDLVRAAHKAGRLAGTVDQWLGMERVEALLTLATKGGERPVESVKAMKHRRTKLAGAVRKLLIDLSADKTVARLDVEQLVSWALPDDRIKTKRGTPRRRYIGPDGNYVERPPFFSAQVPYFGRPTLSDILKTLAERLASGDRMSPVDPIHRSPFTVQAGRGRQAFFEHYIVERYAHLMERSATSGKLWAPAIEVALNLPLRSVDADALSERFRKIYARFEKKSSGKS